MNPWLLAARPKTLVAGLVPVLVGTAAAHRAGRASIAVFFAALLGALFIQVGANYVNDAADFLRGADNHERIGPQRMAQLGVVTPRQLYFGAGLCFFVAAIFGAYLIFVGGWPIAVLGAVSILAAIAYTAGPLPLAYLGLGDFFVLLFFGLVAVCGTYFVHGHDITTETVVWGLAVGAHAMALIAVNNIRDIATDTRAGKKTLAVLLGEQKSKVYILVLLALPYLLVSLRVPHAGTALLMVYFSLPLAFFSGQKIIQADKPEAYMAALPLIAVVQLLFGVLLSAALYWAAW